MKPIIFDVDTGIDDALAMAYALNSPELEVLGFTTCFGNVPVEDASRNTLAVLEKLDRQVPVYPGASERFKRGAKEEWSHHVHGEDGLGNTVTSHPTTAAEEGSAADFIVDQVKGRPDDVILIAVGPLTNIAHAIKQAPEIIPLVKELVIMGGAVTVPGNVTQYAEANIYADPEAADYVFQSGMNMTLVGLDVTMQTLLPSAKLKDWRDGEKAAASFFADMTEFYMGAYETFYPGIAGCALHDPLAVGVVIDASFVGTEEMSVKVVTEGEEDGRTVGSQSGHPKISVCTTVEKERFLSHFLERIEQFN